MKHRVIDLGPSAVLCATCHTCISRANLDKHLGSRVHRHYLDVANAERHARRERDQEDRRSAVG